MNTETLLEASTEVNLEVNNKKIKYMVVSCHQNAGQNNNLLIANKSSENLTKFKCFRTRVPNQIALTTKLRADYIWRMLTIIHFQIFCQSPL